MRRTIIGEPGWRLPPGCSGMKAKVIPAFLHAGSSTSPAIAIECHLCRSMPINIMQKPPIGQNRIIGIQSRMCQHF